jgi:hypothetical protein
MSISTQKDPLDSTLAPERVAYAVGALLGVEDFTAEQTYHRGRLARTLSFLDGYGTVSGLRVDYQPPPDEEIIVRPGIAFDRLGRIIEVPRDICIRLDKWYAAQSTSELVQAFHAASAGVIVDVFLLFVSCDRGLTPAFATGPFDATDYTAASRTRDAFELSLVLRKEGTPPLPVSQWPDLAAEPDVTARRIALHKAILDSFSAPAHQRDGEGALVALAEHAAGQDPAAVFLARAVIPAASGSPPLRTAGPIAIDNESRTFVYPIGALARWAGI